MRSQTKRPAIPGIGQRNGVLEGLRTQRVLAAAAKDTAKKRQTALPMLPESRLYVYHTQNQGRPLTPAQRRRSEKKANRLSALVRAGIFNTIEASGWHNPGSAASTATDGAEATQL